MSFRIRDALTSAFAPPHYLVPPAVGIDISSSGIKVAMLKKTLHGITLEKILTELVARHGWAAMGKKINIRCFNHDPSLNSSLKFLRKTPWARKKVEEWYCETMSRLSE